MNGEVFGGGVEASGSAYRGLLSSFNLGAFTLIYSGIEVNQFSCI